MLISGESYSIGKILSGNLQMQIPDMQRDYCWANTISENNNKSLVENFIEDLIGQVDNEEGLQLGLLYAYESPKNYIQLCDGQQRLTTIYLLLCVLYMKSKDEEILSALIMNPKEGPVLRFQYAIRESTLSFLTDLITEVVLHEKSEEFKLSELRNEDWYFNEYSNDPSIQNILLSLELIDKRLSIFETEIKSAFDKLSKLILNKISFLYFDMQNRTYGEEQFVVLNTTGKPLTKTENMKPLFLGELDDSLKTKGNKTALRHYADLWEEWELFFWKNKNEKHQTADKGLNEFFRWIYIIESTKLIELLKSENEEYNKAQKALSNFRFNLFELAENKEILLDLIQEYFIAIQTINNDKDIRLKFLFSENSLSQINCFELLPLLSFLKKFDIKDVEQISFIRFKNFLSSRTKDENVSKASITTTIEAIRIPALLKIKDIQDIADYICYQGSVSKTLLNTCEVFKFHLLTSMIKQRIELEQAFWMAENLSTSQGNIEYIFKSIGIDIENFIDVISIDKFIKALVLIKLTFEKPTDLLRRSLLTFGNYYRWHGDTGSLNSSRYSLGSSPRFFGEIANNRFDIEKANHLIDFIKNGINEIDEVNEVNLTQWMNNSIASFNSVEANIWDATRAKLISDDAIITSMTQKLFCVSYDEKKSYSLVREKVMSDESYKQII